MQQRGAARLLFIQTQLHRHRAANERRFDGVQQYILRVAVAVLEPAEKLDQLRVNTVHPDVKDRLLAGLANGFVDLLFGFTHHLFDSSGMNATVRYQLLQRQARNFATDRIMS